jgi:hypothetical protein
MAETWYSPEVQIKRKFDSMLRNIPAVAAYPGQAVELPA